MPAVRDQRHIYFLFKSIQVMITIFASEKSSQKLHYRSLFKAHLRLQPLSARYEKRRKDAENTYLKGVFFFLKQRQICNRDHTKFKIFYYYLLSNSLQEKFVNHGLGQTHHAW